MAVFCCRLLVLVVISFIISCLATGTVWEIELQGKSCTKSKFYILNNWNEKGGAYNQIDTTPFPALQTSDIMLKTMGILRSGVSWSGVRLGNLFQRPKATALFLINGLSDSTSLDALSEQSYNVDQTGLTGLTGNDEEILFKDDSVLEHFQHLFNGQSLSLIVSQNVQSEVHTIPSDVFNMESTVDRQFVGGVLSIRESVRKLSSAAVTDSAPDVFLFSFKALRELEMKYSSDSKQMSTALKMVTETIQEVTKELKGLYNNNIVIQALVLQWEYPELSHEQVLGIKTVLEGFDLTQKEIDSILKELPSLDIPDRLTSAMRSSMCANLAFFVELENGLLNAGGSDCHSSAHRIRRDAVYEPPLTDLLSGNNTYRFGTVKGLAEERSDNFPAIFLIIFVTIVPMALSLFAISWAMWNMDPGTNSIIYRNTDPVGIKME